LRVLFSIDVYTLVPGGLWRNSISSEAKILGVAYTHNGYGTYAPYKVVNDKHWLYKNTNVENGVLFGKKGLDGRALSGDEMDKVFLGSSDKLEIIARGENPDNGGGEFVFIDRGKVATLSCGSIACGSGIGVDSTFTAIIENFMNRYPKNLP